jgi:type 1 glutamine amidotransferase
VSKVLLLTGGPDYAHDFADSSAALAGVLRAGGHHVDIVDHPDEAAAALPGRYDALAVNALRWRMLLDRYEPWRDEWGYETPAETRDAIAGFVASGAGLLASHTASICFDDWPGWREVLGGRWDWDRSAHPATGPVRATIVAGHPVTTDLPAVIELCDEVYGDLDIDPAVEPLAVARRHDGDALQPVAWAHHYGRGRVVYDGFGHDGASIRTPAHAHLLRQALAWVVEGG